MVEDSLKWVHIFAAVLATWRLSSTFYKEKAKKPRSCQACLTFWFGIPAVLAFYYFPLANWPFAISQLFLIHERYLRYIDILVNRDTPMIIVKSTSGGGVALELVKTTKSQAVDVLKNVVNQMEKEAA